MKKAPAKMKRAPMKMAKKSPAKKPLVGKQKNLPDALKKQNDQILMVIKLPKWYHLLSDLMKMDLDRVLCCISSLYS